MKKYVKQIARLKLFYNMKNLIPQTAVHDLLLAHFVSPLETGKTKKKLALIVLDGCRSDILPYIKSQEFGIKKVMDAGGLYGVYGSNNRGEYHCETAPCFASMLTGIWANEGTGVASNSSKKEIEPLSVASKIAFLKNEYKVDVFASWSGHTDIQYKKEFDDTKVKAASFSVENTKSDEILKNKAIASIQNDTDALFCFFDAPDGAGHSYGYSPKIPGYVSDVVLTNYFVDEIYSAIKARKSFAAEDWLIVVTTDHGGQKRSHWMHTAYERLIWLATNKKIDCKKYDNSDVKF